MGDSGFVCEGGAYRDSAQGQWEQTEKEREREGEGVNLQPWLPPASGLYVCGACSVFPGVSMLSQRPL